MQAHFAASKNRRDSWERMVLLLTESGVVLLLFQVGHLFVNTSHCSQRSLATLRHLWTNKHDSCAILSCQHRLECDCCDVQRDHSEQTFIQRYGLDADISP